MHKTPNSGAVCGWKGDLCDDVWLFEDKGTEKDFFVVKRAELDKIKEEAMRDLKLPGMIVTIRNRTRVPDQHVILTDEGIEVLEEGLKKGVILKMAVEKVKGKSFRMHNCDRGYVGCYQFNDDVVVYTMKLEDFRWLAARL
jgi:hypothetical protein